MKAFEGSMVEKLIKRLDKTRLGNKLIRVSRALKWNRVKGSKKDGDTKVTANPTKVSEQRVSMNISSQMEVVGEKDT